jgi:RNA polymerase sigma factor (sigma-70 family)
VTTSTPSDSIRTPPARAEAPDDRAFVTTHWSVVLSASGSDSTRAQAALEELCQTYWYPLYAFVRRQGHGKEDAEDLTQEFFARLLRKDYLQVVSPDKGRFRSFLLMALKRFLANEWDRARAQKRGGGQRALSLDTDTAEQRYRIEPADTLSADRIFERRWALTLIERVLAKLRAEFEAAGRTVGFEQLKAFLTVGRDAISYADVALSLGQSEGALRVAVHRLRKRFRELFQTEIAKTVAGPDDIEAEIRHLMSVLAG